MAIVESPIQQSEGRKRSRYSVVTPALVNDDSPRPRKKLCKIIVPSTASPKQESNILTTLPDEVVGHMLSFCAGVEDRFSLQTTCKDFQRISNSDQMIEKLEIGGDISGKNGIIQEDDTASTASTKLTPLAKAGNLEAIYM